MASGKLFILYLCIVISSEKSLPKDLNRDYGLAGYNFKVASQVTLTHFPECSIVFLFILSPSPSPHTFVSTFPNNKTESDFTNLIDNLCHSSSFYIFAISDTPTGNELWSVSANLRRFSSFCKVVITSVPHGTSFPDENFLQLLTSPETPLTKRDLDHFIFLSGTSDPQSNSIFASRISVDLKFKILITPKSKVYTYCMYCMTSEKVVSLHPISLTSPNKLFPDFTKNMKGHPLRVVGPTKYTSVFEVIRSPSSGEYKLVRGLYSDIFIIAQEKLNFTYTFHPCYAFGNITKQGKTGVLLQNGTWAGCVGDLLQNRADFAIATSAVDEDRYSAVEYLTPLCYNYIMFFTHKPRMAYSWRTIFLTFDKWVWSLILIFGVSYAGITLTFEKYRIMCTLKCETVTFVSWLFYLSGNIVGQPISRVPRSLPSKVTFVTWLFYGIVLGTAYSSSLKSLIVSPGLTLVPTTLSELLENYPEWKWGAPTDFRNGLGEEVFKHSDNRVIRQLYKKLERDISVMDCLRKSAEDNYACFHWDVMAGFTMDTEFVASNGNHYPFQGAKDSVMFLPRTWSTRKGEIFKDGFNSLAGQSFDTGLWQGIMALDGRTVRKTLLEEVRAGKRTPLLGTKLTGNSSPGRGDGPKPYRWQQVKACFVFLGCGLSSALLIFSGENLLQIWKLILGKGLVAYLSYDYVKNKYTYEI